MKSPPNSTPDKSMIMVNRSFVKHLTNCVENGDLGCAVGFFTEYVRCGPNATSDWVLDEAARAAFHKRVLDFRRRKLIVLSQFPDDEYGQENRCSGARRVSLHINSRRYRILSVRAYFS
jgi:hypothetical protein